jgi:hypothetical protein
MKRKTAKKWRKIAIYSCITLILLVYGSATALLINNPLEAVTPKWQQASQVASA